ncbi:MmcQ/YjbR family DNA-binding protein [Streptomyces griseorubiginosus]|uniref:MmcQ/YjbR family DNA-binding protein n=1 Tax=Streptomyces griseorubiginosus TaxID=67304 RepID=UPI001AD62782|nr:MmcQ/YjbR family DNA-binding protein [Streptomyces griseorubiginosus]MBO4253057.1 MmcQ/YjbR family DNA-binding protein [Streptomyces griseorubiginosus]
MSLSGEQLQDTARGTALALPGTGHGRPFTEQLDVYKVAGKVFLIVTDDPDELIVTLKAEPEHGRLLQGRYASITPGRYLDKRHWISVGAGRGITADLVAELVDHSYHLVLDTVPRNRRPG